MGFATPNDPAAVPAEFLDTHFRALMARKIVIAPDVDKRKLLQELCRV